MAGCLEERATVRVHQEMDAVRAGHGGKRSWQEGRARKLCSRGLSGTPAAWQGGRESSGLPWLWGT